MSEITAIIGRACAGENLSREDAAACIEAIMRGNVPPGEVGVFLMALREKGETTEEIAGAAQAMRRCMTPIKTTRTDHVDTCGTGGDGSRTFNISTAAAIVTAAAGVPVAKHGNRSITSKTGSADVLAELGVNIDADVSTAERCLDELGLCFCFAPRLHPCMKNVAEIRKQLGVPTIFNLLGPLSNPASAPYQLLGVGKPGLRPVMAAALHHLGIQRAFVVTGADGLDEVTLSDATHVSETTSAGVREFLWTPEEFGLSRAGKETMLVDSPQESAAMIRRILEGEKGPPREIVVLNAAAALVASERETSPLAAAERTAQAIDSGAAKKLLEQLVLTTSRNAT